MYAFSFLNCFVVSFSYPFTVGVSYYADLIHMTNDPKVSMPVMADLLADRLRINNWVVAFKALITSHNLMTLGNEVTSLSHCMVV